MDKKGKYLILRVDAATKQRLSDVAQARGQSLTTFLLEAAEEAARKEKPKEPKLSKPKGSGACPTWFCALCSEVRQGGASTYAWVGHKLARSIAQTLESEYEKHEWNARLNELEKLLAAQDDEAVIAWLEEVLPRCMELIPRRRRPQLLQGIYEEFEKNGIKG
jgi:hypothetical protein